MCEVNGTCGTCPFSGMENESAMGEQDDEKKMGGDMATMSPPISILNLTQ